MAQRRNVVSKKRTGCASCRMTVEPAHRFCKKCGTVNPHFAKGDPGADEECRPDDQHIVLKSEGRNGKGLGFCVQCGKKLELA